MQRASPRRWCPEDSYLVHKWPTRTFGPAPAFTRRCSEVQEHPRLWSNNWFTKKNNCATSGPVISSYRLISFSHYLQHWKFHSFKNCIQQVRPPLAINRILMRRLIFSSIAICLLAIPWWILSLNHRCTRMIWVLATEPNGTSSWRISLTERSEIPRAAARMILSQRLGGDLASCSIPHLLLSTLPVFPNAVTHVTMVRRRSSNRYKSNLRKMCTVSLSDVFLVLKWKEKASRSTRTLVAKPCFLERNSNQLIMLYIKPNRIVKYFSSLCTKSLKWNIEITRFSWDISKRLKTLSWIANAFFRFVYAPIEIYTHTSTVSCMCFNWWGKRGNKYWHKRNSAN